MLNGCRPFTSALWMPAFAGMTPRGLQRRPLSRGATRSRPSAALVFPVAAFALGHPFDRLGDPFRPRLGPLRLNDPFDIFAAAGGWEGLEGRCRFRLGRERGGEVVGGGKLRLRRLFG